MKTLLLIDAHALIHRFFHALPPLTTPQGDEIQAVYGMANVILKIWREIAPDYMVAAFDRPEQTLRAKSFEPYKIHRPPAPQALIAQFTATRELLRIMGVPIVDFAGYEADDIIGSIVHRLKDVPELHISILSGDLDLLQLVSGDRIVVRFLQKGMTETKIYNERAVCERYGVAPSLLPDLKGLIGDPSDNIPGVKGIGPKTATPLIQKYGSLENALEHLWEITDKVGMKIESERATAMLSKQLATIKRDAPCLPDNQDAAAILYAFRVQPIDRPTVAAYFTSLGFTSLVGRL